MNNKLVLCLDGTSNQYKKDNTNVVKLLAMLDKGATDQLVYYQPGVGTRVPPGVYSRLRAWLLTRLDLAFAILLKHQVQDAYRFLMRYHENGDAIYLFGFSRGAYTARVVAGMIHKVGLLAKGNEEMIPFAWEMYRKKDNFELAHGFRNTFGRKVRIHFIGVWDTVSSVRWAWKMVSLPYTYNNPSVSVVRHAVALDERRTYFRQNLWTRERVDGQDVKQEWFPGVHCDVGGGYKEAECGLSKITLKWMLEHASRAGLAFHPGAVALTIPTVSNKKYAAPDAAAKIHESLRGLWWIVELIPKRIRDPALNYAKRWTWPLGDSRRLLPDEQIHPSVYERMKKVPKYRPRNLPSTQSGAPAAGLT